MAEEKDLLQVLWNDTNVLRGKMDVNKYKMYLLGLVSILDAIKNNSFNREKPQAAFNHIEKSDKFFIVYLQM